jgi:hypothetical protein
MHTHVERLVTHALWTADVSCMRMCRNVGDSIASTSSPISWPVWTVTSRSANRDRTAQAWRYSSASKQIDSVLTGDEHHALPSQSTIHQARSAGRSFAKSVKRKLQTAQPKPPKERSDATALTCTSFRTAYERPLFPIPE